MRYLIIILLLLNIFNVQSQTLSGTIRDTAFVPIEFVSVLVYQDTSLVSKTFSDSLGNFKLLKLPEGKYNLKISRVDYLSIDTIISLKSSSLVMLNIRMIQNNRDLQRIIVKSRKPILERKIDRLVFNVEDQVQTVGLDAIAVLAQTPMVNVENKSISIIGKGGISVMIDGRMLTISGDGLIEYLRSIPASNISAIEVITNPPSQYDAQGNGGIINIVRKQVRTLGYQGSANIGLSQATYFSGNAGLNLSYGKKKTTVFGSANILQGSSAPYNKSNIFYPDETWLQKSQTRSYSKFLRAMIGLEHNFSAKSSVGLSVDFFHTSPDVNDVFTSEIQKNNSSKDSLLVANSTLENFIRNYTANIHYKQKIDSLGSTLTVDGDWFYYAAKSDKNIFNYKSNNNGELTEDTPAQIILKTPKQTNVFSINSVIEWPKKYFNYTAGFKLSFVSNNALNTQFEKQAGQSDPYTVLEDDFKFNENTQAVFANTTWRGKKIQIQLGLRGEFTQNKGISKDTVSNQQQYFALFPTVFFTYNPAKNQFYSISYGRRIGRPGFQSFNPFKIYSNVYSYTVGNPMLRPSFNHNIEFSSTLFSMWTTSVSYNKGVHQLGAFTEVSDSDFVQKTQPRNFMTIDQLDFSSAISYNKLSWYQNLTSINVFYSHTKSNIPQISSIVSGWGATFRTSSTFYNKKKTALASLSLRYDTPKTGGISKLKSYYSVDFALQYNLLQNSLQLTLNCSDIFLTRTITKSETINGIFQEFSGNSDSRRVTFNLRYSFGNKKIRSGRSYSGSQSEQGRTSF